ncbi:MAG TPA: filamentous hemagglutinin N-terminal domain-containing protein [Rhizomicrobium sp.]
MNRTGSKILHGLLLATSGLVGSTLIASTAAMAGGGPTGGTVAVGSATIVNASPTQTVVNQSSKKALINWNSFSIPGGSSVKFNQPNSKSLTVNRVTGSNASTIDGALLANGNVWLINANGVLFGKGSQINVGALLATTSDLSDDDFKAGNYNFKPASNPNAAVVNKGTITAGTNGSVILSAPRVSNEGLIQANLGTVVLGGAKAFTVDMTGDNLLRYQITAPVTDAPKDANGSVASALVSNSGAIEAAGGHVMMTARAARNVEDNVINNTGMVEAASVSSHNGVIDLDAGPNGTVNDSGTLDVSGSAQGQTGGAVNVTGGTVNIADGAKINASGDAGGGTIQIGGGLHGQGTLAHAQRTIIGNATISADATSKGNGGTVAVWSDGSTSYAGSISARGGAKGGNGGQVETSGHTLGVAASAKVDTSAPLGLTGDWLLDPSVITIVAESCGTGTSLPGNGTLSTGADPGQEDQVETGTIISALSSTNVTLEASTAINVEDDLTYTSSHTLSLLSQGDINIDSSIQNNGTGAINLIAGWDGVEGHLTGAGQYGLNDGSVYFEASVAVGSKGGKTTIAGSLVQFGIADDEDTVQLGYHEPEFSDGGGGDISVLATGDVEFASNNTIQIGNGSITGNITGVVTGNVSIVAGGDVVFDSNSVTLGNRDGSSFDGLSGNFSLIANAADDENDVLANNVSNNIKFGDVFVGFTSTDSELDLYGMDYNSSHTLTWATASDIWLAGGDGIQNSGTGAINVVAGWDGHTTNTASLTNAGVYGNNGGDVTVFGIFGDVSVGSKGGKTTVLGYDVNVTGGEGHAQIGFNDTGATGAIDVRAVHDIFVTGGNADTECEECGPVSAFAQIGNGGAFVTGADGGNINVAAGGNITVTGGNNTFDYAQIGNGGDADIPGTGAQGDTGNINVSAGGTIDVVGSVDYAQIGNGGWGSNGSTGAIVVTANGDIELTGADDSSWGYAQIGNGGQYSLGNASGNITVTTNGTLTLSGGDDGLYAQIGNGGDEHSSQNSASGNIAIIAGNLTLIGASDASEGEGYAVIGNSAIYNSNAAGSGIASGDISVKVSGTTKVQTTDGEGDAWIGNAAAGGTETGAVTLITGDLDDSADNNDDIGQFLLADLSGGAVTVGITDASATNQIGGLDYNSSNAFTILSAGNLTITGDIQNSGAGNLTIAAGWNPAVAATSVLTTSGAYGNNGKTITVGGTGATGNVAVGSKSGTTNILAGVLLVSANKGYAQIGYHGLGSGAINVLTRGNITLQAVGNGYSAQIGNGDGTTTGSVGGNISILSNGGAIALKAVANNATAAIGNIAGVNGSESGNITINTAGGALALSSNGTRSFAQVGNWANGNTTGTSSGNISISAGDVAMSTSGVRSFSTIGNGNRAAGINTGALSGDITINAKTLTMAANASSVNTDQTRIGNLGYGTVSGNISIATTGNIVLSAVHAGLVNIGNLSTPMDSHGNTLQGKGSGNIAIQSGGAISLLANGGTARIESGGAVSGNVSVTAVGDITLAADNASNTGEIGSVFIGGFTVGNGTINVAVTSTGGKVKLDAADAGSFVAIGNVENGSVGTIGGNISVTASHAGTGDITVSSTGAGSQARIGNIGNGPNVTGNIAVLAGDALTIVGGNSTANNGSLALIGGVNSLSSGALSGNVTVTANSVDGIGDSIFNDIKSGDFTLNSLGTKAIEIDSAGSYNSSHNLTVNSGGDVIVEASLQNAGSGNITFVSAGDVTIGGSGASGNVAVGSKAGTTTIVADSLTLSAVNGYAQLGYHGGGSGAIVAAIAGDVTLNGGSGTGAYAQIGDGGYKVSGSSSEDISVIAGGDIALNGGAGQEAYVQIGNGGAESNSNSSGYSETGLITVAANTVTLGAGSGTGSYAQIGHGGYKSGQSLHGTATLGGDIEVDAVASIALIGGGLDAYAQIGHGGDFVNSSAADGSSGTISGDIDVAVAAPNDGTNDPLTLTAGSGADSYAQIGNGGQGENTPVTGATVSFDISGNVTVADLTLTGSNTGANGYAQIGNGDISKTGTGNVSGDVALGTGTTITNVPGKAPGAGVGLGNATGFGTVTGTAVQGGIDPGAQGSVATITQNATNPTSFILTTTDSTPGFVPPSNSETNDGSQGPTPLEQLADNSENDLAADSVAHSVGQSLGEGKTIYVTSKTIIPGVLKQIVTLTPNNPHGVPPADVDYSSWGNEALWRW